MRLDATADPEALGASRRWLRQAGKVRLDPQQPKLGEVLVAAGVISQLELLEALELQKADPRKPKLGQLLIEKGWATEGEICRALSGQLRLPFVDLRGTALDPSIVALLPYSIASRHQCIAVGLRGDELLVAMADPTNLVAIDDIRAATRKRVKRVVAQPSLIARAIQHYYAGTDAGLISGDIRSARAAGPSSWVSSRTGSTGAPAVVAGREDMPRYDRTHRLFEEAARRRQPAPGEVVDVARELLKPASSEVLEYTLRKPREEVESSPSAIGPGAEAAEAGPVADLPPTPLVAQKQAVEAFKDEARRLVDTILVDALRQGAAEIRGEPGLEGVSVQLRISGAYREIMTVPKRLQAALTAVLKEAAGLDVSLHKVEQEGSLRLDGAGYSFEGSIKFIPSLNGEKFQIKPAATGSKEITLDALGLTGDDLELFKAALRLPRGAILIAGPPDSGVTTTLVAAVSYLVQAGHRIEAVGRFGDARPRGVNVTEVDVSAGMTYAEALRVALRENPKVVVVDDLPDRDIAEQVLIAAMSGHLCLAGIQAADAPAAVTKLVAMGVDPSIAGNAIALVVSQRVVKRVCRSCKEPYSPPPKVMRALGLDPAEEGWVKGVGCDECAFTGYRGTTAFFQLMPITDLMKEQLKVQVSETALMHSAASLGVPTMREAGVAKARQGETTLEEIARVLEVVEEQVISCPGCGTEVKAEFIVCPYCSHPLAAETCASCGEELQPEWVACPYCGAKKAAETAGTGGRARSSFRTAEAGLSYLYDTGPVGLAGQQSAAVLVVGSDDGLRHRIEDVLAREGWHVLGAADAEQALRLTVGHRPGLILIDAGVPDRIDAVDLAMRIRRTPQGAAVPIVYLSDEAVGEDAGGEVVARDAGEAAIVSAVSRHLPIV
jgi:type II secretory ATPase GspE/PulE/Tfp pilus assembly ATPase PilB-like protein/CheY-like chemotaxis protein